MVVVLAVAFLFFGVIIVQFNANRLNTQLQDNLIGLSNLTRVSLSLAIWNLDDLMVGEILEALFQNRDVVYADVSIAGRITVKRSRPEFPHQEFDFFQGNSQYVSKKSEVWHQGEMIGLIRLAMTRESIRSRILFDSLLIGAASLTILFFMWLMSMDLIKRRVLDPLTDLKHSAALISQGDLNAGIQTSCADEIGDLARSFEKMRNSVKGLVKDLRKANLELEEVNRNLEDKVSERTSLLKQTLQRVEKVNSAILESIQYAKRIQRSLLPKEEDLSGFLPNSFILWEPRDHVGGDFFFSHSFETGMVIGIFDCTGHSVPGALMTIVSNAGLQKITKDMGIFDPAAILDNLNRYVKTTLQQDRAETTSDDGLDAAICFVNADRSQLVFAGANLPLYLVPKPGGTVEIIRGEKRSLGYVRSDLQCKFSNHTIALQPGMSIYLATDGFTDQVGGEHNLPLGHKRGKKFMEQASGLPFPEQKRFLQDAIQGYQGNHSRRDDLTVAGFQV